MTSSELGGFTARTHVRTAIEAVVTRKDGTVENLGVVSYWHKNPLRRLVWRYLGKAT